MTLHHSPSKTEQHLAQQAKEILTKKQPQISAGDNTLILTPELSAFLRDLMTRLGNGESLTVLSQDEELTTQQAADILGVSRPYLICLLEDRKIPHRKVGKHRRISLRDLLHFQRQDLAERHAMTEEITALAQEMGLY